MDQAQSNQKPIYVSIWGYSMRIVEFYRVIKETEKTILLRRIKSEETATGYLCGTSKPIRQDEIDREGLFEEVRVYKKAGRIISKRGGYTKLFEVWNGEPVRFDHCD